MSSVHVSPENIGRFADHARDCASEVNNELDKGRSAVIDVENKVKPFGIPILSKFSEKIPKEEAKKLPPVTPAFYREMELALKETLSRRVKVVHKGSGKGELVLEFYSDDELREFAKLLTNKE